MDRPKIIRLWGKADTFDIEFKKGKGGSWTVDIPPDLSDGVYAVTITALNELNESATWVGELFMCNGVCCIKFEDSPYQVWLKFNEYTAEFFETAGYEIIFRKGCSHVRP